MFGVSDGAIGKARFLVVVVDGGEDQWLVRGMRLVEGLSEPYLVELDLVSEELGADTEGMLGASVELSLERGDLVRAVCGVVQLVEFIGVADGRLQVRVEVVPALQLLGQRVDTRLWQHVKVTDVVAEVLRAGLGDYGREVELGNLRGVYPEREAIVQYHESDLDFVSRLMEEEGISYWFDHERGDHAELMVLEDSADNHLDVATLDDDATLRIIVDRADNAEVESLQYFDWTRELTSTAVHRRGFDWLTPRVPIETSAPAAGERNTDARGRVREVYQHGRFVEPDPGPRTIRRLHQLGQRDAVARGFGNVIGMAPGRKFALVDHQRPDLDREYVVRRVVHVADCPEVMPGELPSEQPRYQNRFECSVLDAAKPVRPLPLTPRPRIHGPQTAIVTGPEGEEIHTDEHGRVKVRFDWDRANTLTDDTSMWIRVAHSWAGPGFGTFFLPRVGMEVVVEFLEGDPAKPLISGCVYDGDNQSSIAVPDAKTQSTIRTRSSPASDGYNELRFEDAAGSEAIVLHAQKDLAETVGNDHRTTVQANQTQRVGGNQSESITGSATLTVDENRTLTIKGSQVVTILGEQGNTDITGSKLGITGDYRVDASNMLEIQAPTHIKLVCGDSSIVLSPGRIEITAGGTAKLVLDAAALLQSAAGSKLQLDADALAQSSAGSRVRLDADANLGSTGGSALSLDADATLSSSGGSQVVLDGDARVSGAGTATLTAPTSTLAGEGGSVEAGPAGVNVAGSEVDVAATGIASISGATVKLN
jgi:type VI secretion system secreted protein VgrG